MILLYHYNTRLLFDILELMTPPKRLVRFLLRLEPELHTQIKDYAAADERSVHSTIIRLLRKGLARRIIRTKAP